MGKKEISDKVTLFLLSHPLPSAPSLPFSSTEERSTTESKPIIPLPKSQKSPKSSAICGPMSTKPLRTASKSNTKKTKRSLPRKRPTMRKSTAKSSARRKRKELKSTTKRNDLSALTVHLLIFSIFFSKFC